MTPDQDLFQAQRTAKPRRKAKPDAFGEDWGAVKGLPPVGYWLHWRGPGLYAIMRGTIVGESGQLFVLRCNGTVFRAGRCEAPHNGEMISLSKRHVRFTRRALEDDLKEYQRVETVRIVEEIEDLTHQLRMIQERLDFRAALIRRMNNRGIPRASLEKIPVEKPSV